MDLKIKQTGKSALQREVSVKIRAYPHLEEKIYLQLLLALHEKKHVSINEIYKRAKHEAKDFRYEHEQENPNVSPDHWTAHERRTIRRLTLHYAVEFLTLKQIDNLIYSIVKREHIFALENIANLTDVAFGVLAERVREYCTLPSIKPLPKEEVIGLRVSLIRHFISDQLDFIRIAKHYLTVKDMKPVVDHTIGSLTGHGRIGGKAAGMLLGYKIIQLNLGEKYGHMIRTPESYYLRSDVFEDFLSLNSLTKYQSQKYKSDEEIRSEYPAIQEVFRNGQFPDYAIDQCRAVLKKIGKHPIIVRSSSLLEDNFTAAFSGKYQSIFLGNQGSLTQRLAQLLAAVGEVFASGISPDPLIYRKDRRLIDYDEKIGILIQKVVGIQYRHYLLPVFAGVGLSRNDYTWSSRIKSKDGLLRVVMGLGTRAVDRVGDDYPRLVPLSSPTLRPESGLTAIKRYSQKFVDVINCSTDSYEIVHLRDLLTKEKFPNIERIVSLEQDGYLETPISNIPIKAYNRAVITFENLLKDTGFTGMMRDILQELERVYRCPVDLEFTHDGRYLYLLQTRPLAKLLEEKAVKIPKSVPLSAQIFRAHRYIRNGRVDNIEYIVYCDPKAYHQMQDNQQRHQLARIVGQINKKLSPHRFILMGPGRWGSNNVTLGIPVQYSEINHARALIEVAYREGDYTPEVSFGTHFFLDLVEKGIYYLPLFPDEEGSYFNQEFFSSTPNSLVAILPTAAKYTDFVKVIDIRQVERHQALHLKMDGQKNRAMAYFDGQV